MLYKPSPKFVIEITNAHVPLSESVGMATELAIHELHVGVKNGKNLHDDGRETL